MLLLWTSVFPEFLVISSHVNPKNKNKYKWLHLAQCVLFGIASAVWALLAGGLGLQQDSTGWLLTSLNYAQLGKSTGNRCSNYDYFKKPNRKARLCLGIFWYSPRAPLPARKVHGECLRELSNCGAFVKTCALCNFSHALTWVKRLQIIHL